MLFGKKKKNETDAVPEKKCCCGDKPAGEKSCGCGAGTAGEASEKACGCNDASGDIYNVKVLGGGCAACHKLWENAQAACDAAGIDVKVEYITDMQKVMEYGVMSMPALVVNDKVVSAGRVLKSAEVTPFLKA